MVGFISGIFNLFIIFLKALWLYFTQYIEWADAIALGFLAYLFAYHWQLPDKLSIGIGITVGIVFLLLFHFSKIGWWISTGVFSLMWAYFAGELARSLFHVNDIVYWGAIAAFFCYFVWLHDFAKDRSKVDEYLAREEAAKSGRRHPTVVEDIKPLELSPELREKLDRYNNRDISTNVQKRKA